jgi:high affinity Mn2+ porin
VSIDSGGDVAATPGRRPAPCSLRRSCWRAVLLASGLLLAHTSVGQSTSAAPRPDAQFDFMNLITRNGLHDLLVEDWNAYGQFTYIASWKLPFAAKYTNLNGSNGSLLPTAELGFTGSFTLMFAVRLWKGAEAYVAPEVISEQPLSGLKGLAGAIQDSDLQKGGVPTPALYHSRAYVRQTIELGGESVTKDSQPMQLAATYDRRRLVLVVGNFSILDFFDRSTIITDPHENFFALGFQTYAAWDFNSDARGYSWGGVAELYWDDWAVRFGRITPPQEPNQLPVTFSLDKYYGDQLELEHTYRIGELDGSIRVLGYRNRNLMGRFSDAIAVFEANPQENAAACTTFNYGSTNANAPDLCWVRRPNVKLGVGIAIEQHLPDDFGAFFRGMYADGQTEVDAYTSADRSLSFGVVAKGSLWNRKTDVAGIGMNLGWLSEAHIEYLRLGGVDGFIGDGDIRAAPETNLDVFYGVNLNLLNSIWFLSSCWFSVDYQHVINPAFNADRGPVDIFGARFHVEF